MKAWLSRTAGGAESLALVDAAPPALEAGKILVRVEAVGVNYPDVLLLRDRYQVRPERPFIPGGEFCCQVLEVAPSTTGFRAGDVVVGRTVYGAMAEFVVVAADRCERIPADMPRTDAAAFFFAYATAYHALRNAGGLVAGETLLILGAGGGVGSAAIELGKAFGARVVVAASTHEKVQFALACGAEDGLVCPADLVSSEQKKSLSAELKGLTGAGGADVVLDPVGGNYSEPALRSLGPLGRHLGKR
ncbi:zinc-binding dehydrogenase [Paraburkholderia sp. MM5482-R1]|uniref:zinc-binding dehydrogenase n=1 Tax=unclassified Paraburkholderia TaxID=2615204 RepID=UPI003D19489C